MIKKRVFYKLPVLALVMTGFFMLNACPTDSEDALNTTALKKKIAEAKAERDNTLVNTSDSNVALGKSWVTQQRMTTFEEAIAKAEVALASVTNQSAVNSAVTTLDNALKVFKAARRSGTAELVNTNVLTAKILEAENIKAAVVVSTSAADVAVGIRWVTGSDMNVLNNAIASAEFTLTSATTQSVLNSAVMKLTSALGTFKNAIRAGTAALVDTSFLAFKIFEAENIKAAVVVNTTAANVPIDIQWVTQLDMNIFNNAIDAAKTVRDAALSGTSVDSAVSRLYNAIFVFNSVLKNGAKNNNFTAEELTMLVERAKAIRTDVKTSVNGNDVGPMDSWVSQSVLAVLNAAITSAESASGNIDNQYLTLVEAINAFNSTKTTGTAPNKNNLNNAIINANNAKEGIVVAVNAAQAPYDSSWATTAQWTAFNSACDSALAMYSNGNASQVMVTEETAKLNTAIQTFKAAVQANGLGQKQNTLRITALNNVRNGKTIAVGLFSTLDGIDESFMEPTIYGFGKIANGEATVTFMWYNSSSLWTGTGSWYVGLIISDGLFEFDYRTEFYISKSMIDFTAEVPNPSRTFNDFERLVFSFRLGDIVGDEIFRNGQMTFNALFLELAGVEFDAIMQMAGITYYKNRELTQSFTGFDLVGANTIIYSPLPYNL